VPKPWVIRVLAVWCQAPDERKVVIVKQTPNTGPNDEQQGETEMLLSQTEVKVRSLEHDLRIHKAYRIGWLTDSPRHQNRANPLARIFRSLMGRRISIGLGERVHDEGARSVA
jgi:hypothetical protein